MKAAITAPRCRPESFNATTFHDRERKLQGAFAAARDVSERKHSEYVL